jgi:hypothetical protein
MTFRLYSNEELKHFKAFTAARDRARTRARGSTNPEGACDVSGRELKEAWRRQFGADATMGTGESTAPELDLATIHACMAAIGDMCDEATLHSVKEALDKAFPGCIGDADPESPDTVTDDTADADEPPANSGGKTRQEAMIAARRDLQGATDDPFPFNGMPRTGGTMVKHAQDAALRFRRAEKAIRGADQYARDFPSAARIGIR